MTQTPTSTSAPLDGDLDLREFLRVVKKHVRLIGAVAGSILGLAFLYVFLVPRVWQAKVTIKLPDAKSGNPLADLALLSSSADPVETYLEVARSYNVAMRTALAVSLTAKDEYKDSPDLASAVAALQGNVAVSTVKLSNILVVQVNARDPQLAAELANTWAQAFIDANLSFTRIGARSRREFIDKQMEDVKGRLLRGEDDLRRLSTRQRSLGGASAGNTSERSPIIALQGKAMELDIERATLASRYSADHPRLQEIQAQLKETRSQLERQMARLPKNEMDYTRQAREVKADEAIYNLLLEKFQEARIAESVDDSGIVVVDTAQPPRIPLSPRKVRILALCLFFGLMGGLGAAWGVERWRDEVGGEDELARMSDLPVLALVPDWRGEGSAPDGPVALSLQEPPRHDPSNLIIAPRFKHTYYAESFKVLRTNLAFSQVDRQLKFLSILSPGGEEGKTLTNANLALALAATGKKVLLVDADLRKPSVHKLFGIAVRKDQGLPLLLSGQAQLSEQLLRGPVAGLWLLPCGVLAPNPAELLGSDAMLKVLKSLARRFDHVVFDAPPVLPVTDSVVLATRLDGVALMARFERTRRDEFKRALEHLQAVRAPVLGCVLNAVDMRKYAYAYGYGRRYYAYGSGEGKA